MRTRPASTRTRAAAIVVALAVVAAVVVSLFGSSGAPDPVRVPPAPGPTAPALWSPDAWDRILGGDSGVSEATWATLDAYSAVSSGGVEQLEADAGRVVTARLTGTGADAYPQVFNDDPFAADDPDVALAGTCSTVQIVAASAADLPIDDPAGAQRWAKVAVAWSGSCAGPAAPDPGEVRVSYTYAAARGIEAWVPVRETTIPGSGWRWLGAGAAAELSVPTCGNPRGLRAAAEVAAAFDVMCEAAKAAGVTLEITSGWRSAADQQALWDTAASEVGEKRARRWVIEPTAAGCSSRHCDGSAIDVDDDGATLAWLDAAVSCAGSSAATTEPVAGACPDGTTAVPRHLYFGFLSPHAHVPNHLEWGLPLEASGTGGCRASADSSVAGQIAATWRCTLAEAGVDAESIRVAVAGAVTQARCASGWSPGAVASNGRYLTDPDPRTGEPDTRAGVHLLNRDQATKFVTGGYTKVTDLEASAAGAARLWLDQRAVDPWAGFTCATEAAVPEDWAYDY